MRVIKDVVLLEGFKDRRGRRYNREDLEKQIQGKVFYGELDSNHGLDINLSRVSHSLENIRIDDDGMRCDINVLDTPLGKVVESLIDAGVELKTSIRATGLLGDDLTVSDLTLITFDLIGDEK